MLLTGRLRYAALFEIANSFTISSATIEVLREHLRIGRAEAIRQVLKSFMAGQGIDLGARTQLRWLAIELLDSMQLARSLLLSEKAEADGTHGPDASDGEGPSDSEPEASRPAEAKADIVATHVAKLDPRLRPVASILFAARKVTFDWTDNCKTELTIRRESGSTWTAQVRNPYSVASYTVRLAPDSLVLYELDTPCNCAGAPYGSPHDLSQLRHVRVTLADGVVAAQQGQAFAKILLVYDNAKFKNLHPNTRWS